MPIKRPLKTEHFLCKNLISEMDIFQICYKTSLMGIVLQNNATLNMKKNVLLSNYINSKSKNIRYSQFYCKIKRLQIYHWAESI